MSKNPEPEDLVVYHLTAKGCSGKAVRCRVLTPEHLDAVVFAAAKRVGPDSTHRELARIEQREGVRSMVVDVTRARVAAPGADNVDPTLDPDVKWEPFDPDAGQLNTKDWITLMAIFTTENSVMQSEVDAILGKARSVAAG